MVLLAAYVLSQSAPSICFQSAITFIQCLTWVSAAQAMFSLNSGPCFLANACAASSVMTFFARHSFMKAILFCRMLRLVGFQSSWMGVASRVSSAVCIRVRYAAIGPRQDEAFGLLTNGITISASAMVLWPTDFIN